MNPTQEVGISWKTRCLSLAKNILAILFGCIIAFFCLEILVRVLYPQEPRLFVADPYIRTIHRPSVDTERVQPEYTSHIRTNAQGFVGDDFVKEKKSGVTRIAMLGDSFTEGFSVDIEKSYVTLLQEKLNAGSSTQYEVYNFGIGGAGPTHESLIYEHYIRPYTPDVVVYQFYNRNDYSDDLLLKANPTSTTTEKQHSYGRIREFFSNNFEGPRFVIRHIEKIKAIKDVLVRLSLSSRDPHHYDSGYPFYFDVFNASNDTTFKTIFPEVCQTIGKLKKSVENDGATFFAYIVPAKEQIFSADWDSYLQTFPTMKEQTWDMSKPSREIRSCFDTLGIPYVDLEKDIRLSLEQGGERMYYQKDDHFNVAGNALAAQSLFDFLRSRVAR